MSWQETYRRRVASPDDAVGLIRPGDRVIVPLGNQPRLLCQALARRANDLPGIHLTLSAPEFDPGWLARAGQEGAWQVEIENFIGTLARPFTDAHQVTYFPNPFSLGFKPLEERPAEAKPIDVVLVSVTPPNRHGLVSFGAHAWFKKGYVRRARTVIAEVNPSLLPVHGDCWVPIERFAALVEVPPIQITQEQLQEAISTLPPERRSALEAIIQVVSPARLAPWMPYFPSIDLAALRIHLGLEEPPPEARAIAELVKPLIPHGATIQIGVGTPAAYLTRLGVFDDKVDLGLHTEMVAPGIARLVAAGVINGRRKTIHRERAVAVAWSGSDDQDLEIIRDNPLFELYEPEYLLNPWVIAQNFQQTAINNALMVDLTGQINSESVFGGRMVNGIGGQPETHIGALYSKGGRAITLLPSTALNGSVSRIVPRLEAGEVVTIPRYLADTVVTEYGVATLLGKNLRERANALIAIAHPDFRSELRSAVQKMF
ncbi:MAG: acetyl-CoA hydrolase/transferase family protein [Dehalococcoidia bacterium]